MSIHEAPESGVAGLYRVVYESNPGTDDPLTAVTVAAFGEHGREFITSEISFGFAQSLCARAHLLPAYVGGL